MISTPQEGGIGRGTGTAFAPAFGASVRRRDKRRRAAGRRPSLFPLPLAADTIPSRCSSRDPTRARAPRLRHGRRVTAIVAGYAEGLGPLIRQSGGPESCTHSSAYGGAAPEGDASTADWRWTPTNASVRRTEARKILLSRLTRDSQRCDFGQEQIGIADRAAAGCCHTHGNQVAKAYVSILHRS